MLGSSAILAAAACWQLPAQAAAQSAAIGDKLPKIEGTDLVEFIPDSKKTPSLRAGMIDSSKPYKFALPASWKEERVANIQSGNFCAPRCDEPWTEVIFQNPAEGKLQLIISPLRRLTSKATATIDQIGSPEGLLGSIGPFITGTSAPDEEEVLSAKKVTQDGRLYYLYEANSQVGPTGPHILASCTTKDSAAYIFFVSANERQWGKSQAKLKQVVQTFRA